MDEQSPVRDRWTDAGIWVVGGTAAIMSWAGWVGLADLCGLHDGLKAKNGFTVLRLAWLLPLTVDVYAVIAARTWLRLEWVGDRARRFAKWSTVAAIGLGMAANGGYHWMAQAGWQHAPWPVVVGATSLAPVMLGAVAHLSALTRAGAAHGVDLEPAPVPSADETAAEHGAPDDGTVPPAEQDVRPPTRRRARKVERGRVPRVVADAIQGMLTQRWDRDRAVPTIADLLAEGRRHGRVSRATVGRYRSDWVEAHPVPLPQVPPPLLPVSPLAQAS